MAGGTVARNAPTRLVVLMADYVSCSVQPWPGLLYQYDNEIPNGWGARTVTSSGVTLVKTQRGGILAHGKMGNFSPHTAAKKIFCVSNKTCI